MANPGIDDAKAALSRRGFLKGVSAGSAATALLSGGAERAEAASPIVWGPEAMEVTLSINGKKNKVKVEPRVTLLDLLRNQLDLTGAKKVCDRGTCGACTVIYDGQPAYSCSILAVEAEGHEITTIEGFSTPEKLNEVQRQFVEHDGQQCGFCTPGFIVACTAFLDTHPGASLEEIQAGLGGNLCRCGTYAGITDAMVAAAKSMKGGA